MSYYDFDQERKIQDLQRQVDLMNSQEMHRLDAQWLRKDRADIHDSIQREMDKLLQADAQYKRGKISQRQYNKIRKEYDKAIKYANKRIDRLEAHPDRPSNVPSEGRQMFCLFAGAVIGFILGRWAGLIIGIFIGVKVAEIGYK